MAKMDTNSLIERVRWPEESVQKRYTGRSGKELMDWTVQFISVLEKERCFDGEWRGLDYGCGWGRIASVINILHDGAVRLDMCDAWQETLNLLDESLFYNHRFKVSEVIQPHEITEDFYTFIYSFSIFTHLSESALKKQYTGAGSRLTT